MTKTSDPDFEPIEYSDRTRANIALDFKLTAGSELDRDIRMLAKLSFSRHRAQVKIATAASKGIVPENTVTEVAHVSPVQVMRIVTKESPERGGEVWGDPTLPDLRELLKPVGPSNLLINIDLDEAYAELRDYTLDAAQTGWRVHERLLLEVPGLDGLETYTLLSHGTAPVAGWTIRFDSTKTTEELELLPHAE